MLKDKIISIIESRVDSADINGTPEGIAEEILSLFQNDEKIYTTPSRIVCRILKHIDRSKNNIISDGYDNVILSSEDNPPNEVDGVPVVRIIKRDLGGPYYHAEPVLTVPKMYRGYMMSGCYIMGSTSMGFPHKYPIPLHDHYEKIR